MSRDKTQLEAEVGLYRDKVAELEATLFQSKDTAKTSLDSLSKRLLETTQELNACHIEKQRTEAKVSALKEKLSQLETMSDTRAQTANTEVAQLQVAQVGVDTFPAVILCPICRGLSVTLRL